MDVSLTGLFSELDGQPHLGVTNYGVSMTTLEDVFLRLEAETEVDQAGACVAGADGARNATKMPSRRVFFLFFFFSPPCPSLDYSVFNRERPEEERDSVSEDDTDQKLLMFSDGKSDFVSGQALWRQQFSTVSWLHMLNMRRERKAFLYT